MSHPTQGKPALASTNMFAVLNNECDCDSKENDDQHDKGSKQEKRQDSPRLVFVFGPPGSGKTGLCDKLLATWNHFTRIRLENHIDMGKPITPQNITESLVKAIENAETRAQSNNPDRVNRYIISGFPESTDREFPPHFKKICKQQNIWYVSRGGFAIVLDCDVQVGRERTKANQSTNGNKPTIGDRYLSWRNNREDLKTELENKLGKGSVLVIKPTENEGRVEDVVAKVIQRLTRHPTNVKWLELI